MASNCARWRDLKDWERAGSKKVTLKVDSQETQQQLLDDLDDRAKQVINCPSKLLHQPISIQVSMYVRKGKFWKTLIEQILQKPAGTPRNDKGGR